MTLTADATSQKVMTPSARQLVRRSVFWVIVALFLGLIVIIAAFTTGSSRAGVPLSASNPAPGGARAVAQVLSQHGVTVVEASNFEDARAALGATKDSALLVYDPNSYLPDNSLRVLVGIATATVLINPTFDELQAVTPSVALAGVVSGTLKADCDLPAVQKARAVTGTGSGYRVVGDSGPTLSCLGSGDHVYSLVQVGATSILGTTAALTNETVIDNGNAALALNLLGAHKTLVWYLPTLADTPQLGPADISALTPGWVTPVILLLMWLFVISAIWRGRRLGPVVIENLPVTVRASETMLGRARLYESSSARLRALDALRVGTIARIASLCGLPRAAGVDQVCGAAASVTGGELGGIRQLLVDRIPMNDRDLIALSDSLLTLERDVSTALRR